MPTDRADRRRLGAWATPPWLVGFVVDLVEPLRGRVLDPACGDGRFLAEVAARAPACSLVGVDVDPDAIAAARAAAPGADLREADALAADWDGPYDVVVGNPPFLNQLAVATSRGGRSPLGGGAYADAAALFLALALRLAREDGGRVALVLPVSVLSTRDAAPIRTAALAGAALEAVWWAGGSVFDAAVDTCVLSFVRGRPQGAVRRWAGATAEPLAPVDARDLAEHPTWSHLLGDAAGVPEVVARTNGTLTDVAVARAGFRDQFYGLVPFVSDGPGAPLVTSGLIDPGRCAWGERPARFAGTTFGAPTVDLGRLRTEGPPRVAAWVAERLRPKVLVATQTPVVEACVDERGEWVPSVPVLSVEPRDVDDLWALAAVLCSPVASAWAARTYLGAGLSPGAIKLSARQVLGVPRPEGSTAPAERRLALGDLDGCGVAMLAAYGLPPDHPVLGWWRAGVARSLRR